MSLLSVLIKPFVNKAKKDLSDAVRAFIEARKHADEDGNGEEDFAQVQRDAGDVVQGCKLIAGGSTRIAALLMCYYLKFKPAEKVEAMEKVALLTQNAGDLA